MSRFWSWIVLFTAAVIAVSCVRAPSATATPRFLIVGIDGADWGVIRRLWDEGGLPTLRSLAARGTTAELDTAYGKSPVIWTTIATGRTPEDHGISDFVVPTSQGDVPVNSTMRNVPALWDIVSRLDRRVAVIGWWATWPVEPVHGMMVSERILQEDEHRIFPPRLATTLEKELAAAQREPSLFRWDHPWERLDKVIAYLARGPVRQSYDLVMLLQRSPDPASHHYWRYFEPAHFPPADLEQLQRLRSEVPHAYAAVDEAIGRLLGVSAREDLNVVVISDHGFHAAPRETVQIVFDADLIFERLGYTHLAADGVDRDRSELYTYASPDFRRTKYVHVNLVGREPSGRVRRDELEDLRARLARDLAEISYAGGEPAFLVRDATQDERDQGADFVVEARVEGATEDLIHGDGIWSDLFEVNFMSGVHGTDDDGIFIAAGPQIAQGADIDGVSIHDIAPTILYGLGLPVARDFSGRPFTSLFTEEFRARTPVRTIETWGYRNASNGVRSSADDEVLQELRALGYLE